MVFDSIVIPEYEVWHDEASSLVGTVKTSTSKGCVCRYRTFSLRGYLSSVFVFKSTRKTISSAKYVVVVDVTKMNPTKMSDGGIAEEVLRLALRGKTYSQHATNPTPTPTQQWVLPVAVVSVYPFVPPYHQPRPSYHQYRHHPSYHQCQDKSPSYPQHNHRPSYLQHMHETYHQHHRTLSPQTCSNDIPLDNSCIPFDSEAMDSDNSASHNSAKPHPIAKNTQMETSVIPLNLTPSLARWL